MPTSSIPDSADTSDAGDLAELSRLNAGFIRAVAASDGAWFEQHCSDDFVNSNADGTISDRASFIRNVSRPSPVTGLAAEDVLIRLFGESALIHARTTYVKPDGKPGAGRYTDVWARVNGQWLCAAADVTRC